MCGIAGFFSKPGITKEQKSSVYRIMTKLLVETQTRGSDATGFSYVNEHGKLVVIKGPVTAQKMVLQAKWVKLEENMPQSLMAHTRQATLGTPLDNFNNHPLTVNKEFALIHNGMIGNHAEIKTVFDLTGKGAVDSEVIAMLTHKFITSNSDGKFNKATYLDVAKAINMTAKQLDGGFACAAMGSNTPEVLYLFDHNNPIVLAYCEELDTIFFASTEMIIKDAIKIEETFKKKFGVFKIPSMHWHINRIDNDTITVLKLNAKKQDKDKEEISVLSFALSANDKLGTWNGVKREYNKNCKVDATVAAEPLKAKEAFTGAGTSTTTQELEDWEVGSAIYAGDV